MFLFKSSSRLLVNEVPVMNEARPATGHSRLRRSLSTLKRWLREPLLHFLLIGLVLFGLYAYTNRGRIVTPLKDRIGSVIRTHYPLTREIGIAISDQNAWLERGAKLVIINNEATEQDDAADLVIRHDIGETLGPFVGN